MVCSLDCGNRRSMRPGRAAHDGTAHTLPDAAAPKQAAASNPIPRLAVRLSIHMSAAASQTASQSAAHVPHCLPYLRLLPRSTRPSRATRPRPGPRTIEPPAPCRLPLPPAAPDPLSSTHESPEVHSPPAQRMARRPLRPHPALRGPGQACSPDSFRPPTSYSSFQGT